MITKTIRNCLFAATLGLPSTLALAIEMPRQGMSMDEVRSTYGNPERDLGAVGKPAITRWVYDGYTVYFEGRRVVHTVRTQSLHGSASAAAAPSEQPAYEPAPVAPDLSGTPTEEAPAPAFTPEPVTPAPYASEPAPALAAPALAPEPEAAPAPAPSSSTSVGGGFRFDPVTGRLIIDDSETPPAEEPAAEPATAPESDAFAAPAEESMNDEPVTGEPAPTEPSPFAEPATEPAPAFAEPAAEPAFAEPAAEPQPAATEPASAAAESPGNALDDTLEFDPETGTFRPRQ